MSGCPCGDTNIKLYEGSTLQEHHTSAKLDIFLKGSNKQKLSLQQQDSSLFSYFQIIWDIRTRHMVQGLPSMYIFFLKCCFQPGCEHPICSLGPPSKCPCWYPEGPPLSHIPLPVQDPSRPWGGQNCDTCKGFCAGHYSTPFTGKRYCLYGTVILGFLSRVIDCYGIPGSRLYGTVLAEVVPLAI